MVLLTQKTLGSLSAWVQTMQAELVKDRVYDRIHSKAVELDLSFYDLPAYYDRMFRARLDAYDRPVALLENIGALIQNTLTFVAMGAILTRYAWWFPVLLVIGMLPALLVISKTAFKEYEWRQESTEMRRRAHFYDWIITDREFAAEMRLFDLGGSFMQGFQTLRATLRSERAALLRSQALMEAFAGLAALVAMGSVMVWMVWQLALGTVSLGQVAMVFQAFNQGQKLMETLLGSLGQIIKNMFFLENLFEFLGLKSKQTYLPVSKPLEETLKSGICFEQVTFHYPGNQRAALQDF